ncbi:MAG: DUF4367 domain-containing protein [Candidatus Heteroscillospira sp.]
MSIERRKNMSVSILNALSEDQLKDILRAELAAEDTDVELIKRVNAALATKGKPPVICDTDQAWDEFVSEHMGVEPIYTLNDAEKPVAGALRKGKRMFRAAAVAAILAMLFVITSATAYALGFDLWGAVANWTTEHFSFIFTAEDTSPVPQPHGADIDFSELKSILEENGVTEKVVPSYIPEGYSLKRVLNSNNSDNWLIYCSLSDGENSILLQYTYVSTTNPGVYSKDDTKPEEYTAGDVEHYIMTNNGMYMAVWKHEFIECSILGAVDKAELLAMIDSIYYEE